MSELFHAYSTGFMPQTIFFLAQHTAICGQLTSEQLMQQFRIWATILQPELDNGEMNVSKMLDAVSQHPHEIKLAIS